jgi:hypothetical protein
MWLLLFANNKNSLLGKGSSLKFLNKVLKVALEKNGKHCKIKYISRC